MCRNSNMGMEDAKKGKEVVRTVMWSPPRSLSTTVERCLIENKDIHVVHEPFGVPFYWSSEAGSSREDGERSTATYASVAQKIFRDPGPKGQPFVFSKNLSYYVSPHCIPDLKELLGGDYATVRHSFMIRHPAKAISSLYFKSCVDNEKTGYTHFDPTEAGFTAMAALLDHLEQFPECPPLVIIDADDLLEDPEGIMQSYCDALGLPFDTSMLTWEAGPEHCPELASPWSGWTDDVQQSSGIKKRSKRSSPPEVSSLPKDVRDTIQEAMPIYERMYAQRVRASGNHGDVESGSPSSSSASGGKAEVLPCLPSPCCKACVAEPAKVTGTILLLISVMIWVRHAPRARPRPHRAHRACLPAVIGNVHWQHTCAVECAASRNVSCASTPPARSVLSLAHGAHARARALSRCVCRFAKPSSSSRSAPRAGRSHTSRRPRSRACGCSPCRCGCSSPRSTRPSKTRSPSAGRSSRR